MNKKDLNPVQQIIEHVLSLDEYLKKSELNSILEENQDLYAIWLAISKEFYLLIKELKENESIVLSFDFDFYEKFSVFHNRIMSYISGVERAYDAIDTVYRDSEIEKIFNYLEPDLLTIQSAALNFQNFLVEEMSYHAEINKNNIKKTIDISRIKAVLTNLDKEKFKRIIQNELSKESPNWLVIEKSSASIVDSNTQNVRFSVDAGHIQKLGFELVGKQETALIELIKNAYDADATEVNIEFIDSNEKNGTLVIKDNGSGMNIDTIKQAWMSISTDYKKINTVSPRFGRTRAGRKGIGRFAVQRLGTHLEIISSVKGHTKATRVIFNWDDDFTSGKKLSDVFSQVEYLDKDLNEQGTTLNILNLREIWTSNQLKRAWHGVLSLQSPFKPVPVKGSPITEYEIDPGFETIINGVTGKIKTQEISMDTTFLNHALAEISGEIDCNGIATVTLKSQRLQLDEVYILDQKFLLTGELTFSTKYFIYRSEFMSGNTRSAQNLATEYGGVRIYRNGFRVLPYGERSDDWLRLDRDSGRRTLLMPAANTNFFGGAYLSDVNELFEETSSREGLLENEAFEELASFVRDSIEWAITRIASIRNRKQSAGQKNFVSELIHPKKPTDVIKDLKESLLNMTVSSNLSKEEHAKIVEKRVEQAEFEAELYEDKVEAEKAASLEYEEMLRILSSLGISIAIFGHEIKGTNNSLNAAITLLKMRVTKITELTDKTKLENSVQSLEHSSNQIFNVGKYIGQIMSHTESRELKSVSLSGAIKSFYDQFSDYLLKKQIIFELNLSDDNVITTPMHQSEITSVLLNFMTNSIKFLRKTNTQNPHIRVSTLLDGDHVLIRFEDNGPGVSDKDKNYIFDAFYTTSIGSNEDLLDGVGTGLGLKIVSDIANSYGGSAQLGNASQNYNCCFEFRVLKG